MTSKKWDDPQLDAAQFAIDRFLNAKQNVSEKMAAIYQSIQDGSATDEDRKRLKGLREQYIALSKEVEDVMGRLLVGKQLPHPKLVWWGEGEMTGTPRRPWTPERDKELRALVLSANSVDTIAKALNRTTFAVRRRANTLRLPLRKIARLRRLIWSPA
jgi:hypothetical protein